MTVKSEYRKEIHKVLSEKYGYETFRTLQEDVMLAVLNEEPVLAIMPTGGGKSLCYQIPTIVRRWKTIVVSPLIALMEDQVREVQIRNLCGVAIHSGMSEEERRRSLDLFSEADYGFLFVSPERLLIEATYQHIDVDEISLIVIDEAHCVSQWGHDFRPAYRDFISKLSFFGKSTILSLTATASPAVLVDLKSEIYKDICSTYVASFKRNNLRVQLMNCVHKDIYLLALLNNENGSKLVFRRNRADSERLSQELEKAGFKAGFYHGGMQYEERQKVSAQWFKNELDVLVCTNAFGMGINKNDVRLIVHMDVPPSIEEYYQEIGRAGRDGKSADCILLYDEIDIARHHINFNLYTYSVSEVVEVLNHLAKAEKGVKTYTSFSHLGEALGVSLFKMRAILKTLRNLGYIDVSDSVSRPSKIRFDNVIASGYAYSTHKEDHLRLAYTLLQQYENLFTNFVYISEQEIADNLIWTVGKVSKELHRLLNEGHIIGELLNDGRDAYTLIRNEMSKEDERYVGKLSGIYFKRFESIIQFISEDYCRLQLILNYFGEESVPCGKCDICVSEKSDIHKVDLHALKNMDLIQHISRMPMGDIEQYMEELSRLESEGMIILSKDNKINLV